MKKNNLPSKYKNLKLLESIVNIPKVILLQDDFLSILIENLNEINKNINEIIENNTVTSGSFFNEYFEQITSILLCIKINKNAIEILDKKMISEFGEGYCYKKYAVRSANSVEDLNCNSFAGLYDSYLNVKGANQLFDAVIAVYKSGFTRAAVFERMKMGVSQSSMNVMIQDMVDSKVSGVAFSVDPLNTEQGPIIEYVYGYGDKVVSGEKNVSRLYVSDDKELCTLPLGIEHSVILTLLHSLGLVEKELNTVVDVEWSWDGESLYILQARPITTFNKQITLSSTPVFNYNNLYCATDSQISNYRLPEFASYFRQKRKPLFDIVKPINIKVGKAFVVELNFFGFSENGEKFLMEEFSSESLIVDLSENFRQIVVSRKDAFGKVLSLLAQNGEVSTAVIREYIRGEAGFITQIININEGVSDILCEYSRDGLMALNRGTAQSSIFKLSSNEAELIFNDISIEHIRLTMDLVSKGFGPTQIEWVIDDDKIYPIDFSSVDMNGINITEESVTILSNGYAKGVALNLADCDELYSHSIAPVVSVNETPDIEQMGKYFKDLKIILLSYEKPPILIVSKPYAALAVLIPYVQAFVFESSSVLCHLAILLRENKVPALASPEFKNLTDGLNVTVDTCGKKKLSIDKYRM